MKLLQKDIKPFVRKAIINVLVAMNYNINEIEYVKAVKIKGSFKADIQVQIKIIIKLNYN